MHPDELLPEYALGTLSPRERADVEAHVEACAACRSELHRLQEVVIAMVEDLPAATPPPRAFDGVRDRIAGEIGRGAATPSPGPGPVPQRRRPRRGPVAVLAAGLLAVALLATGTWGVVRTVQVHRRMAYEQEAVATWLARGDVRHHPLRSRSGSTVGSVLVLNDGRAMFVLPGAAEGRSVYQAWGHVGEELVPLSVSDRPVFEVATAGYDALYLSLEPPGGSAEPTRPLGWIGL